MKIFALPLFFALLTACNISYAQNSIFAGKIVDENNNPVANAVIKISSKDVSPVEAKTDTDGLYCTKPLATGHYHLAVFLNSECRGLKKVTLDEISGSKKFFLIKMRGGNIDVSAVDKDPAMAVKLEKINADHSVDGGNGRTGIYHFKVNEPDKVSEKNVDERYERYIYTHKRDSTLSTPKPAGNSGEKTPQQK
jgi:hypothetical protein